MLASPPAKTTPNTAMSCDFMDTGQGTTQTRVHACNTQTLQMCANNNTCEYSRAEPNVLSQPPHSHAFSSHLSSLSTHIHTQCQEDHAVFISTLCFIAQIALLWSGTWSKPQTETIATHFCGNSFACPLYTHTLTHALPHSTRTHSSEWLHIFSLTLKTYFRANGHNDELLFRCPNTEHTNSLLHHPFPYAKPNAVIGYWPCTVGNTFCPLLLRSVIL